MKPTILFPSAYLNAKTVDPDFNTEDLAARETGLKTCLLDIEAFDAGDLKLALKAIPPQANQVTMIYRGWMMTPETYKNLYDALKNKNYFLINSPVEYHHTHHLPKSFPLIKKYSPPTVWLPGTKDFDFDEIMFSLAIFGDKPIIVKDYVKSLKHHWHEACFIPCASDRADVERVVGNLIKLQGDDLVGGLVFRQFVELMPLGEHSQSGMPLTKEFRLVCLNCRILFISEYWDEGEYKETRPPRDFLLTLDDDVVSRVHSDFFTLDIAETKDGKWIVMELGDAQVAGLPPRLDPRDFYQELFAQMTRYN